MGEFIIGFHFAMVGVLIFCPTYPWFLERKRGEKENRDTMEKELKSLPAAYSFEVLFMNCSISSILGIKCTIETVSDVVYSPEPRRSWNIEVINVL